MPAIRHLLPRGARRRDAMSQQLFPRARNGLPLSDRLWRRIDRSSGADACWLWRGATNGKYGTLRAKINGVRQHIYAHRLAYEMVVGKIPDDIMVCHKCDVPLCCNPGHLWLGTQRENLADARAKGRARNPPPTDWRNATHPHHWAKITRNEAFEILKRARRGEPHADIARDYGIDGEQVRRIKLGERWPRLQIAEDDLHLCVADFLRAALGSDVLWTTVPLGGGGRTRGALLKAMGALAGLPDLMFLFDRRAFFIELKTQDGELSGAQRETHARLKAGNYDVAVCRSVEEVVAQLRAWGIPMRGRIT
jgi:hypothetical protein